MDSGGDNLVQEEEIDILPELPRKRSEEFNKHLTNKSTGLEELKPLKWTDFFDRKEIVKTNEDDYFNVYFKGSNGPLFFLIHGGGLF